MAGLQTSIYVGIAIPWFSALISLVLRAVARRMTRISWWYDDYFSILAFLFATGYCGIMLEWTMHSYLGVKLPDSLSSEVREAILQQSRLLAFFNSLCYATSIACSKIAILALYWRLFQHSNIRRPIIVLFVMVLIWIVLRTFMLIFRCVPVQAIWDYSIKDAHCNINSKGFFFGTIITHFLMDVAILLLPVVEVARLHLRLGQKLAIIGLFLLGSIVCVASMCVLIVLVNYNDNTTQMPHDYAMFCILGSVELNIAVVSACFPLLRPVFGTILPHHFLSSYGRSSQPISRPSFVIKLRTLTQTRNDRERADDTSSTHQLADPENGLGQSGVNTVISSSHMDGDEAQTPGIVVHNETFVEIEDVEVKTYGMQR